MGLRLELVTTPMFSSGDSISLGENEQQPGPAASMPRLRQSKVDLSQGLRLTTEDFQGLGSRAGLSSDFLESVKCHAAVRLSHRHRDCAALEEGSGQRTCAKKFKIGCLCYRHMQDPTNPLSLDPTSSVTTPLPTPGDHCRLLQGKDATSSSCPYC